MTLTKHICERRCIQNAEYEIDVFQNFFFIIILSGGIKVRIPQELDVAAFWSWNLDVVAFCRLKKCLGITMSWVNCLRFSMSRFFDLGISMSWFFGLGILMSYYICLQGLVFVFTKSIMPQRVKPMCIVKLANINLENIKA